jgi:hypothetical protein
MVMTRYAIAGLLALVCAPSSALAQTAADFFWQIGVVTEDLTKLDTNVAVSNSGAESTTVNPQNGGICVNVYATSAPSNSIAACCTCRVPANALREFSVANDVLGSVQPKAHMSVVKLLSSTGSSGVCNAATVASGPDNIATGMLGWLVPATSRSAPAFGKTATLPATLSAAELVSIRNQCSSLGTRACNSACAGP